MHFPGPEQLPQAMEELRLQLQVPALTGLGDDAKPGTVERIDADIPWVVKGVRIQREPVQETLAVLHQKILHGLAQVQVACPWEGVAARRPDPALEEDPFIKTDTRVPIPAVVHQADGAMHGGRTVALPLQTVWQAVLKTTGHRREIEMIGTQLA
ncbi:hypothetical protein D3C78_1552500 [compost metagenome]